MSRKMWKQGHRRLSGRKLQESPEDYLGFDHESQAGEMNVVVDIDEAEQDTPKRKRWLKRFFKSSGNIAAADHDGDDMEREEDEYLGRQASSGLGVDTRARPSPVTSEEDDSVDNFVGTTTKTGKAKSIARKLSSRLKSSPTDRKKRQQPTDCYDDLDLPPVGAR